MFLVLVLGLPPHTLFQVLGIVVHGVMHIILKPGLLQIIGSRIMAAMIKDPMIGFRIGLDGGRLPLWSSPIRDRSRREPGWLCRRWDLEDRWP